MTHVFISYRRKDAAFVEKLERELNACGTITWRDVHSIPGGSCWFGRIKAGLEARESAQYPNVSANQLGGLCGTGSTLNRLGSVLAYAHIACNSSEM